MSGADDLKVFPSWQLMDRVGKLSRTDLDRLPFGAIELDPSGRILTYNAAEGALSGRDSAKVIGKSFFTEVAPCTNVREFAGAFREGMARKELNVVIPYRFDFQMAPVDVWVRLFYSKATNSGWVFVTRRDAIRR